MICMQCGREYPDGVERCSRCQIPISKPVPTAIVGADKASGDPARSEAVSGKNGEAQAKSRPSFAPEAAKLPHGPGRGDDLAQPWVKDGQGAEALQPSGALRSRKDAVEGQRPAIAASLESATAWELARPSENTGLPSRSSEVRDSSGPDRANAHLVSPSGAAEAKTGLSSVGYVLIVVGAVLALILTSVVVSQCTPGGAVDAGFSTSESRTGRR